MRGCAGSQASWDAHGSTPPSSRSPSAQSPNCKKLQHASLAKKYIPFNPKLQQITQMERPGMHSLPQTIHSERLDFFFALCMLHSLCRKMTPCLALRENAPPLPGVDQRLVLGVVGGPRERVGPVDAHRAELRRPVGHIRVHLTR